MDDHAAAYVAELNAAKHHAVALELEAEAVWSTPRRAARLRRRASVHERVSTRFQDSALARVTDSQA